MDDLILSSLFLRGPDEHRGIDERLVVAVARDPEQTLPLPGGREVRQSRFRATDGLKMYLLRVILEVTPRAVIVVTAYRTSRLTKYWRES